MTHESTRTHAADVCIYTYQQSFTNDDLLFMVFKCNKCSFVSDTGSQNLCNSGLSLYTNHIISVLALSQ